MMWSLYILNLFVTLNHIPFPVTLVKPTSARPSKELLKFETLQLRLKESVQSR